MGVSTTQHLDGVHSVREAAVVMESVVGWTEVVIVIAMGLFED